MYESNLEVKLGIIEKITQLSNPIASSHKAIQTQIKVMEGLKNDFFNAGKVPQKNNEATWKAFKAAVKSFNQQKK